SARSGVIILVNGSPTREFQFYKGLKQGQWSESNIDTIIQVLDCFYQASGLHINMNKSKLLGISVETNTVDQAAAKIGCANIKTPFSYLGLTVGGNMSRIKSWDEIIAKVKNRLSKWKMKTLSTGGRLTLLKSVLGLIPIYHMSLFKVPKKVLQRLEAIRSLFSMEMISMVKNRRG
ncbi:hypothetical protein Tco_0096435, partial [Tanacetum coccineum]